MPKRVAVDKELVMSVYGKTGSNRKTARQLGIHENTVINVRRLARGMCHRCGQNPVTDGYSNCQGCREWMMAHAKQYRVRHKAEGVCVLCDQSAMEDSIHCVHHREYMRVKSTRNRVRDRARLGEDRFLERQRERNRRASYGDNAVSVWKQQKGTCQICFEPYSKRKIHLHHIDGNHDNGAETNLICLCMRCHKLAHQLIAHKNPLLVIQWVIKTYTNDSLLPLRATAYALAVK